MSTIQMKDILPPLTPASPIGHRNLTLVPLIGGGERFQNYLLASEALDAGVLTITEVDAAGTVPELMAVNTSDRPVLLLDGEELQGAKQNRILNTSVLLPPKSKTRIPVSCVEEGRWSHVSATFKTGHYAPSSLRQRKSRDVRFSLRTRGRAESDQAAVWDSVAAQIHACEAASPTRALSDAMATMSETLKQYQEALQYPAGACGVVAAVCGHFVALDAFDSPSTLETIWPRLIASYAADAERTRGKPDRTFSANAADVLLEHLREQEGQVFNSVGLGHDIRFETTDIHGQALGDNKHLLHLSVFPPASSRSQRDQHGPRISPPSRRRY